MGDGERMGEHEDLSLGEGEEAWAEEGSSPQHAHKADCDGSGEAMSGGNRDGWVLPGAQRGQRPLLHQQWRPEAGETDSSTKTPATGACFASSFLLPYIRSLSGH